MTQHESNTRVDLSPGGTRRRAAIKAQACTAAANRARGARFVSAAAFTAAPVAILVVVWSVMFNGPGLTPGNEFVAGKNANGREAVDNGTEPNEIRDETSPYKNFTFSLVSAREVEVHTIDDDELLDLLAAAGRPSGLIRIGDHVRVVEHAKVAAQTPSTPPDFSKEPGGA